MRRPHRESQQHGTPITYPAPFRGWVDSDNAAMPTPGGAAVLDNMLPTRTGARVRGGSQFVSTVPAAVDQLITYDDGINEFLFAVSDGKIHNASALDGSAAPVVQSGLGSGEIVSTQFNTVADTYLYVVGGTGSPRLFDGSTWQTVTDVSSPISITGATGPFSAVWSFKSRLFFAKGMQVYFLPTGEAGGAASDLNLAGVFKNGGRILFGTSWSSDSGAGFGDRCIIATDRGEIAVFEGSDPASASDWALVGRYVIPPILGPNAHLRVGGDVLIATTEGLLPVSGIVSKDPLAVSSIAISRPIAVAWRRAVALALTSWQVRRWPSAGVILIGRPDAADLWGVYAETGAWFRITGWDAATAITFKGRVMFAGKGGIVRQGDTTGQDDGEPFVARCRWQPSPQPAAGIKVAQLARATLNGEGDPCFSLSFVNSTSQASAMLPDPWVPGDAGSLWDSGVWDQMTWTSGMADLGVIQSMWRSVSKTGGLLAPEIQIVSDNDLPIKAELLSVDAIIEGGGIVG